MRVFAALFLFFISCAKREQEDPLMFLQNIQIETAPVEIKKEIVPEIIPENLPIEVEKEEVVVKTLEKELDTADREMLQKTFNLTDSIKEIKPVKVVSKKTEQKPQNKPQVKQKEQVTKVFVFDDKYYPVTKEDAKNYAFGCYNKAKIMSNIDSVRIVSQKGLSMYENSSLYYLFAKGLSKTGNHTLAANNCKTALSRDDFWGDEKNETVKLLVEMLQKTYEKTPSEMLLGQISKYKEMVK